MENSPPISSCIVLHTFVSQIVMIFLNFTFLENHQTLAQKMDKGSMIMASRLISMQQDLDNMLQQVVSYVHSIMSSSS